MRQVLRLNATEKAILLFSCMPTTFHIFTVMEILRGVGLFISTNKYEKTIGHLPNLYPSRLVSVPLLFSLALLEYFSL